MMRPTLKYGSGAMARYSVYGARAGRLVPGIWGAQGGAGVPDDDPPRVVPGDFSRTMRWMAAIFCGSV